MENNKRIKILFYNKNKSGVNYYRTLTPAVHLDKNYSDDFEVVIKNDDFDPTTKENIEFLKTFDIVHYHLNLTHDVNLMLNVTNELKSSNVKLVMDIDDYWILDKDHPKYNQFTKQNIKNSVLTNLKIADYITTTTEHFANHIREVTKKDNVIVLGNSIDTETMPQFENNWKPHPDGIIRIMYLGGSTHIKDVAELEGVVNMLNLDPQTKNKFMFVNVGWDMRGEKNELIFNENLKNDLKNLNLWNQNNVKKIVNSQGDMSKLDFIPQELKEKYHNSVFQNKSRPFKPEEIPYYYYEQVFTDKYKIIDDRNYLNWLKTYSNSQYPNETKYVRRWTKPVNEYAKRLDYADIVLAPLRNTKFNNMKSSLKQIEAWTRKLPVVCSDVIPYNVDGVHMHNSLLVPDKPNNKK
ncbi:MAG: hypothetical protein ACOC2W_04330, partial [bacterium]